MKALVPITAIATNGSGTFVVMYVGPVYSW